MKRRTIIYVIMLFVAVSTVNAQSVTYIHENDIMNQFLTMETGAGALTPAAYYNAFHKSYQRMITNLEKYDLLIWDDFGLQPMDDKTRLAMLQILEERYERKSVIIASQLPIAKWYDYIGNPTLADAIMDRLVANASKIELKGDSMRQKLKK